MTIHIFRSTSDNTEILAGLWTSSMVSGGFRVGLSSQTVRVLRNVIHADHLRTAIDKGLAVQAGANVSAKVFLQPFQPLKYLDVET